MGHSDIESPLLNEGADVERQVDARISRVNEDYVPLPKVETRPNASLGGLAGKGRKVLLGVGICCIAALLLVSAAFVSYTLQAEGLDGDGGNSPSGNAEFLKEQRLAFHFRPESNYMSGTVSSTIGVFCW
jgi:hypothetical protein